MPKQKTHSGTKKRFRVTRNGKVLVRQRNRGHLSEKKSAARMRRLAGDTTVEGADAKRVKRLLEQ